MPLLYSVEHVIGFCLRGGFLALAFLWFASQVLLVGVVAQARRRESEMGADVTQEPAAEKALGATGVGFGFSCVVPVESLSDAYVVVDLLDDLLKQRYPTSQMRIHLGAKNALVASALKLLPLPTSLVKLWTYDGKQPGAPGFLTWLFAGVAYDENRREDGPRFVAVLSPWDRLAEDALAHAAREGLNASAFQAEVMARCRVAPRFFQPIEDWAHTVRHRLVNPAYRLLGVSTPLQRSGWFLRADLLQEVAIEGERLTAPFELEVALHRLGHRVQWASSITVTDTQAGGAMMERITSTLQREVERLTVFLRRAPRLVGQLFAKDLVVWLSDQDRWRRSEPLLSAGESPGMQHRGLRQVSASVLLVLRLASPLFLVLPVLWAIHLLFWEALMPDRLMTGAWTDFRAAVAAAVGLWAAVQAVTLAMAGGGRQDVLAACVYQPVALAVGLVLSPWAYFRLWRQVMDEERGVEQLPSSRLLQRAASRLQTGLATSLPPQLIDERELLNHEGVSPEALRAEADVEASQTAQQQESARLVPGREYAVWVALGEQRVLCNVRLLLVEGPTLEAQQRYQIEFMHASVPYQTEPFFTVHEAVTALAHQLSTYGLRLLTCGACAQFVPQKPQQGGGCCGCLDNGQWGMPVSSLTMACEHYLSDFTPLTPELPPEPVTSPPTTPETVS